jgi:hypothetical protein
MDKNPYLDRPVDEIRTPRMRQHAWNQIQAQGKPKSASGFNWAFRAHRAAYISTFAILLLVVTAVTPQFRSFTGVAMADFELLANNFEINEAYGEVSFFLNTKKSYELNEVTSYLTVYPSGIDYEVFETHEKSFEIVLYDTPESSAEYVFGITKPEGTRDIYWHAQFSSDLEELSVEKIESKDLFLQIKNRLKSASTGDVKSLPAETTPTNQPTYEPIRNPIVTPITGPLHDKYTDITSPSLEN